MGSEKTFRDLTVWQKAIGLAKSIYAVTQSMPATERFGLISQMRRAAVSIPSNIAEGNARASRKDYIRMLVMARGSLAELETQLIIARELHYLHDLKPLLEQLAEVSRMLQALIAALRRKNKGEDNTRKQNAVLPPPQFLNPSIP